MKPTPSKAARLAVIAAARVVAWRRSRHADDAPDLDERMNQRPPEVVSPGVGRASSAKEALVLLSTGVDVLVLDERISVAERMALERLLRRFDSPPRVVLGGAEDPAQPPGD